jgi:argininosuccinate synthase
LASFSMEGYDVTAARGFIDLFGLPMKVASQAKRW